MRVTGNHDNSGALSLKGCAWSRLCIGLHAYKAQVVEAEILALGLGTEGGVSQWCNRLPEVVMTLGGRFCV